MVKSQDELESTKRLMGALVRMKPKPHDEMKVGKSIQVPGTTTKAPKRGPKPKGEHGITSAERMKKYRTVHPKHDLAHGSRQQ